MGNELSIVEQRLREILAQAPGGRVHFPKLGTLLRDALPGFSAEAYGFPTLKALLQQVTIPGRLVQTGTLEWWLVADGAEAPIPSVVARGSEPSAEQEQASAHRRTRIESAWWRVVTEFDETRRAWFDLQDEQLSTDDELAAAEPERFLAVPRFGLQQQRDLARAWSAEQPSPVREDCLAALEAEPKLARFLRVVQGARSLPKWSERRMEAVHSVLLQWAKEHGIDPQAFLFTSRALPVVSSPMAPPPSRSPEMSRGVFPQISVEELRRLLHRVIEDMTEPELLQIAIPARFLVRR